MKKRIMVVLLLLMATVLGCSSKDHFAKTNDRINQHIATAKVPVIQGMDVNAVLLQMDHETKDGLRNTVVITYTDQKGKRIEDAKTDSSVSVLYGPYEGEKVLAISISKAEAEYSTDMQTRNIHNLELEYAKVQDHLIIHTRHNGLTYTLEGRITKEYTEDRLFEMFAEAVGENEI